MGAFHDHLLFLTADIVYPPGRRTQVSLACLAVADDHHVSICQLINDQLNASAFALLRPMLEATVKSIWLSDCATDRRIEQHVEGRELPAVKDMLRGIMAIKDQALPVHNLVHIAKSWGLLSSLTHSGHHQVRNWLSPDGVEPLYGDKQLEEVSSFVGYLGYLGALARARLGSDHEAFRSILTSVNVIERPIPSS